MIYISLTKSFFENVILLSRKGSKTTVPKSKTQTVLYIIPYFRLHKKPKPLKLNIIMFNLVARQSI